MARLTSISALLASNPPFLVCEMVQVNCLRMHSYLIDATAAANKKTNIGTIDLTG